jgi:hypothetical protein
MNAMVHEELYLLYCNLLSQWLCTPLRKKNKNIFQLPETFVDSQKSDLYLLLNSGIVYVSDGRAKQTIEKTLVTNKVAETKCPWERIEAAPNTSTTNKHNLLSRSLQPSGCM